MNRIAILSIIVLFSVILFYSVVIEPELVTVTHQDIYNSTLAKMFSSKVIVQLSDLHISTIGNRERRVLEVVEKLQPDYIFLTGDYVAWNAPYKPALEFLSRLHAKVGIWGVLGDYDYHKSRQSCLFCHFEGNGKGSKLNNIHFLKNTFEVLENGNNLFRIGGVDKIQLEESIVTSFKKQLTGNMPTLLLCHNPLLFNEIESESEIVMLSGDTHGGQLPLPSFLWRWMGYRKNELYNYGLFKNGKHQLFVSHGIGYSHLPFRFMREPEVVLIKFITNEKQ